jgi:Pyridoxamine 5'-phosphate oxidase
VAPRSRARSRARRTADTRALFESRNLDAWVATASADGVAHLVPLSLAWDGARLILATEPDAVTTRNLAETGRARLGVGTTRDVVMVDARLESTVPAEQAPAAVLDAYLTQAVWDPRDQDIPFVVSILAPERVQAWREADEITGRTLMRDGAWLG